MSFNTPILFLIFNRPDVTARVFEELRKLKPKHLYIAADGPRPYKQGEAEKCKLTRQLVIDNIDWECEKNILLRTENFGCGKSVSTAINWFFDHVEEGIILEDDCLPHPSFFTFCQELLSKYRLNQEIMHIGGSNFLDKDLGFEGSYYFTNYIHIWGWATWRRAWKTYQFSLPKKEDPKFDALLKKKFKDPLERDFWKKTFYNMAHHPIDTWDTQWVHSFFMNNGIGITPAKNLISNIGFGAGATHTVSFDATTSALPLNDIGIISHPAAIKILQKADRYSYKRLYQFGNTRFNKVKFVIGQKIPAIKKVYLKFADKKEVVDAQLKLIKSSFLKSKLAFLIYRIIIPALLNGVFYFVPRRKDTLLIIKNDGIGDYILFRNYLQILRNSPRFKNYQIYLLGNTGFKDLALYLDSETVDGFYWYQDNYFLKWSLVKLLFDLQRARLETVVYANYSRRFTVDWLVNNVRATIKVGIDGDTINQNIEQKQNTDKYYTQLVKFHDAPLHEFNRNGQLIEALTDKREALKKPFIDKSKLNILKHNGVVVFPGGSEPQKRWAVASFQKLCLLLIAKLNVNIILAGSRDDIKDAALIARNQLAANITNRTGGLNLVQLCELIGGARLLISNDTVAIHIAVALDIPVICIAKGDLFGRFIPYPKSNYEGIQTVFPPKFAASVDYKQWSDLNINDILPDDIYQLAEKMLTSAKVKIR